MDECSADTTVAVGERVNRLELGVDQSGLDNRCMRGTVEVLDEICHEVPDEVGRRARC